MQSNDLLPQLVRDRARTTPNKTFLQEVDGRSQTYAHTHSESLRFATAFRDLGVTESDRVLAMLHPSLEMVNMWIGLGWLKATHMPINTEYQGSMLQYAVINAKTAVIVCGERYLDALLEVIDDIGEVVIAVVRESTAPLPVDRGLVRFLDFASCLPDGDVNPDGFADGPGIHDLSMMMYTSGTTGASKAVMIPWGSVANAGRRAGPHGGFAADEIFYSMLPMFHAGFANWIHGIAAVGGSWVFRERWSTRDFWNDVRRYSCTTTFLLGAMANFLGRQAVAEDEADNPMRSMVSVPLPEDVEVFERRFGLEVVAVYGSTEMGIPMKTPRYRIDSLSCGRPFPEYEARVVDNDDNEVPIGEVGEIVLRPLEPWISFVGYFGKPEATVAVWQNLWFHSGDFGRRDKAGNYYFVDRKKDSIRRRGENISSVEVEAYVFRHDAVFECAAIPVPSEWGEDEVKVCIVLKPGQSLGEEELIEALIEERMPRFMIPRFIGFFDELPKGPTGKIQKDALRTHAITDPGWDRTRASSARIATPGKV